MTEQLVYFPDIEATLVAYLRPLLDVPVVTRVPNPRPPLFLRLIRVGGGRSNRINDVPMVTLEAWAAAGDVAAFDLARKARAHVNALPGYRAGGTWFRRVVDIAGPASFPDPESGTSRYQFTLQIHVGADDAETVRPPGDGTRWWIGWGPPEPDCGPLASPWDLYLDMETGDVWACGEEGIIRAGTALPMAAMLPGHATPSTAPRARVTALTPS